MTSFSESDERPQNEESRTSRARSLSLPLPALLSVCSFFLCGERDLPGRLLLQVLRLLLQVLSDCRVPADALCASAPRRSLTIITTTSGAHSP